jgi:hypothetical protein
MHGLLKKLLFVLLFASGCFVGNAQQSAVTPQPAKAKKQEFRFITSVGVLAGASGRQLQLQSVAGLHMGRWQAGIGTGIDYYYFRGVPLFADLRRAFLKSGALFSYANIGLHLPWVKEVETDWFKNSYQPGLYYDLGAGWQVKSGRKTAVLFSAGYSGKTVSQTQTFDVFWPRPYSPTTDLKYHLRRISIKAGFRF